MSRYESKSEAFGQGILKDQRQRADKIAKEQESFAKKVAGIQTVVKGVNSYLDNRLEKFNTSLADERAFLTTRQKQAKNILDIQAGLDAKNESVESYIRERLLENRQTALEKGVEGVIQQRPDNTGKIVEKVVIDIPKATLAKRKDWKKTVMGEDGNPTEIDTTFEELVKDGTAAWNKVVNHARNVPTKPAEIEEYLKQFAKEEMPTNMFTFVTRGLKNVFSNETAESLEDKISKTTAESLSNPLFNSFTNFANASANINSYFPNLTQDGLASFENTLERKNGKIVDNANANKIVSKVTADVDASNAEVVVPGKNKKENVRVLIPTYTTTYEDGTSKTMVDNNNAREVKTGEDLLVLYDNAFLNIINDEMTPIGIEEWAKYSAANNELVASNPMLEWTKFIESGIVDDGRGLNKYLKPDIDITKVVQSVVEKGGISFAKMAQLREKLDTQSQEEYDAYVKKWQADNLRLQQQSVKPVFDNIQMVVTGVEKSMRARN